MTHVGSVKAQDICESRLHKRTLELYIKALNNQVESNAFNSQKEYDTVAELIDSFFKQKGEDKADLDDLEAQLMMSVGSIVGKYINPKHLYHHVYRPGDRVQTGDMSIYIVDSNGSFRRE